MSKANPKRILKVESSLATKHTYSYVVHLWRAPLTFHLHHKLIYYKPITNTMLPFSPGGRKKTTNSKPTVSSPKTVGNLLPPLKEALQTVKAHLDEHGLSQELVDLYRAIQVKMNEPTGSKDLSPPDPIRIPRPSKLMQQNDNSRLMLKNPELLLSFGLECVGFDKKRQSSVRSSLNIDRFTGHYGTGPKTVQAMLKDLASHYPHIAIKNVLMTLYWLKTYVTQHVMSGTWGHSEDFIGKTVKEYTKLIQSLKSKKIVFGGFDDREIFWVSVDKVNFLVEEFRLDPSTKWYDFKSKSRYVHIMIFELFLF